MDFKPPVAILRKEASLARELLTTAVAIVVFGGMGVLLLYSSIGFPEVNPSQKAVDICIDKSPGDTVVITTRRGYRIQCICRPLDGRLLAVPYEIFD